MKNTLQEKAIQSALDYIDAHLEEPVSLYTIAAAAGYSQYHFSRMFSKTLGMPVRSYITQRRLQFAAYRLSQGARILDVALEYGFETHAGFTKAFKQQFGYPPSLCFLHTSLSMPGRATPKTIQEIRGTAMNPHIMELTPFSAIGYAKQYKKANVKTTADIPTFWNSQNMDTAAILTKLHNTFTHSKHFEVSMCCDVDETTGDFTYLLGRGIDNAADFAAAEPDMTRVDIPGGLYAIFSTPPADDYIDVVRATWNEILTKWLPGSEFEFDDSRPDFEYYDHRDHGWYFGGKVQMDICVPICQRADAKAKSQARCEE